MLPLCRPAALPRCRTVLMLVGALGCAHSEPFAVVPPDSVGPFTSTLPRQLTFNPLPDITPSAHGDTLIFSRRDAIRADGDRCVALLPVEGGRLLSTLCARGNVADTVRDVWLYPAMAPDGQRVAFVRERYLLRTGSLLSRDVAIVRAEAPDSALVVIPGAYDLPDGSLGNGFRRLSWMDERTLRFLGGLELAGGGALRGFVPSGVFEVTVSGDSAGIPELVPELADAVAYAPGDDEAIYFVSTTDPTAVQRLASGSTPTMVARFTSDDAGTVVQVTDIAESDSVLVGIATVLYPEGAVRSLAMQVDLASGVGGTIPAPPVEPDRVAGVPSRGLVVVEAAGDLWLVAVR